MALDNKLSDSFGVYIEPLVECSEQTARRCRPSFFSFFFLSFSGEITAEIIAEIIAENRYPLGQSSVNRNRAMPPDASAMGKHRNALGAQSHNEFFPGQRGGSDWAGRGVAGRRGVNGLSSRKQQQKKAQSGRWTVENMPGISEKARHT